MSSSGLGAGIGTWGEFSQCTQVSSEGVKYSAGTACFSARAGGGGGRSGDGGPAWLFLSGGKRSPKGFAQGLQAHNPEAR